jgi:hypothetical protein
MIGHYSGGPSWKTRNPVCDGAVKAALALVLAEQAARPMPVKHFS